MSINLEQISKIYRDCTALNAISLNIKKNEVLAILGPSGSGKSTLLKIIAGLEIPTQGQIYIDKQNVTSLHPKDRKIGFVFQHYALFKHMTVFENIAFGLKVKEKSKRLNKNQITEKVNELGKLVQIDSLYERFPHELSGGQRQRVALARALAIEPKILLLDEPFAALDAKLKLDLRRWLRKIQQKIGITIILVTHDQEEALDIADTIMILNHGKIEQIGTPDELYHKPCNPFVYNFLGHYNVFKAIKTKNGISILDIEESNRINKEKWYNKHKLVSSLTNLFILNNKISTKTTEEEYFEIFVRPHDIEVLKKPKGEDCIEATVAHINLAASLAKLELDSSKYETIHAELTHDTLKNLNIKKGDQIFVKPKQFTMFE